jgi:hypothetical protein
MIPMAPGFFKPQVSSGYSCGEDQFAQATNLDNALGSLWVRMTFQADGGLLIDKLWYPDGVAETVLGTCTDSWHDLSWGVSAGNCYVRRTIETSSSPGGQVSPTDYVFMPADSGWQQMTFDRFTTLKKNFSDGTVTARIKWQVSTVAAGGNIVLTRYHNLSCTLV